MSTQDTSTGGATAAAPLRVIVLAGGLSHERDVSVRSGRRVATVLREAGMSVEVRDVDSELLSTITEQRPDVVFPLLHGSTGEDGSLRSVLQLLGVPFVGSVATACRVTSRKPVAKGIVRDAGVATPPFATLPRNLFTEIGSRPVLDAVVEGLGLPLAVKPEDGGSALGVSIVTERSELPEAMVRCFSYGDAALIERAVSGTEVAISILEHGDGAIALPPVEIVTDGAYDYDARYNAGRTEYFVPARLSADVTADACAAAVTAHRALGLRDLSRVDLIIDDAGTPWLLDVNVAPGMTETSLFPQAVRAHSLNTGTDATEMYADIVRRAAARGGALLHS